MSRILVAYASHYGQTRKIAERIAEHLGIRGHEIQLVDLTDPGRTLPHPDAFDVVVLGSRIEVAKHAKELLAYVRRHRPALQKRPTAFFSVSMSAANPNAGVDPSGYLAALSKQLQWEPSLRCAFAGGLPYRKYGIFTRLLMKAISRGTHGPTDTSRDHELTSWADVDAFSVSIDALSRGSENIAATPGR